MAKVGMTIDDREFTAMMERQAATVGPRARKVLTIMGAHMMRSVAMNFQRKGRIDDANHVWPELAESTIGGRRRGQRRRPMPLQRTGTLKNSITSQIEGDFTLDVGTNVPYAKWHQQKGNFGGRAGNLPARPFLIFHKGDIQFFERQALKEFGGG